MDRRTLSLSQRPPLCRSNPLGQIFVAPPMMETMPDPIPVKKPKPKPKPQDPAPDANASGAEVIQVKRRG